MDMNHLAIEIHQWANEVFPNRTPQAMFLKLYHEIAEMIDETGKPEVEGEIADVLIMILDFARGQGVNPSVAVQRKMKINRARQWKQNPLGDYSHVKDEQRPGASEPLRVLEVPRPGSRDAVAGGEALAHDRDNTDADPCRTHGKCLAASRSDCLVGTRNVLQDGGTWIGCPRTRRSGIADRGYSHPHEAIVRIVREGPGEGGSAEGAFIIGTDGTERDAPSQAV